MRVVVISSEDCAPCKVLKKELNKLGIKYAEHDIEMVPREYALHVKNISSVPITLVFDDEDNLVKNIVGYSSSTMPMIKSALE